MEIYTPAFNRITDLLKTPILEFIGENIVVDSEDVNKFVLTLKEEHREEKDYNLIEFTYSYPYSQQVQDLLVDLIRRCIIDQTDEGYTLSSYGLSLIGNDL